MLADVLLDSCIFLTGQCRVALGSTPSPGIGTGEVVGCGWPLSSLGRVVPHGGDSSLGTYRHWHRALIQLRHAGARGLRWGLCAKEEGGREIRDL